MAVEQRVELGSQRRRNRPSGLDELAVRAHDVDHVPVDRDLEGVARAGEQPLQLAVQRAFAQLADHRCREGFART